MYTPQTMNAADFHQWWIESQTFGKTCKECGRSIEGVTATLSIHSDMFPTCAGQGRVAFVDVPYCPVCEAVPKSTGCLHVAQEVETLLMLSGYRVK